MPASAAPLFFLKSLTALLPALFRADLSADIFLLAAFSSAFLLSAIVPESKSLSSILAISLLPPASSKAFSARPFTAFAASETAALIPAPIALAFSPPPIEAATSVMKVTNLFIKEAIT